MSAPLFVLKMSKTLIKRFKVKNIIHIFYYKYYVSNKHDYISKDLNITSPLLDWIFSKEIWINIEFYRNKWLELSIQETYKVPLEYQSVLGCLAIRREAPRCTGTVSVGYVTIPFFREK